MAPLLTCPLLYPWDRSQVSDTREMVPGPGRGQSFSPRPFPAAPGAAVSPVLSSRAKGPESGPEEGCIPEAGADMEELGTPDGGGIHLVKFRSALPCGGKSAA